MNDKRAECRILAADLIEVRWTDSTGNTRSGRATLEDISPSGVCLQFELEVPAGTRLLVLSGNTELPGTVRHCQYCAIGYFVGVQFDPGIQWTVKSFKPKYMLDPRSLMPTSPDSSVAG